jgi:ABC-type transport system substrate-binding protein/DNA-binding SARP family transcriptional activator
MFWKGNPLPRPATLKSQSLLAYLLLHRQRPQSRDHLCNLFWGDRSELKARGSISTALWHIRRCLPEDIILRDGETLQYNPGAEVWLDVEEFKSHISASDIVSLASGVELYRGELLAGFYDDWIVDERYHLESLYCAALERLMSAHEAEKKFNEALVAARRLLHSDPLKEAAHRLIMRAHHQLGQRNAALLQYQTCRELIRSQLGVEPMEETNELYQAILHERPAMPLPSALPLSEPPPLTSIRRPGYNPLGVTAFGRIMGRKAELDLLNNCWVEMSAGPGKFIFLGGEAGVGKTRLVTEFINSQRFHGTRILFGRCYEFERVLPYQPIFETLRSVLPSLAADEGMVFPSWLTAEDPSPPSWRPQASASLPDMPEQRRLFEDVLKFLLALSRRGPLLIVLEDLHWAAESTLELLHYLVRHLMKYPVLWIGTYRAEDLTRQDSLQNLKQVLQKEQAAVTVNLGRLSATETEALISEMSGEGSASIALARRLYEETEGNPFFLMEIVKALFESGALYVEAGEWRGDLDQISRRQLPLPESVSEAILSRVRALSVNTQNALQLAAVLGREFDFELLNQAWGRDREATLEALDVLLRQRFIEEGQGRESRDYVFIHHKIPEVIYSAIPGRKRQMLHAKVAMALEILTSSRSEPAAGQLAYHFERCQELDPAYLEGAVRNLLRAGDGARFLYAFQDALDFYQRALTLFRKIKRYDRAAETLMKIGLTYHTCLDFEHSRQAYEEGLALRHAFQLQVSQLPSAPHPLRVGWREPNSLDPAEASFEWSLRIIDQLFCGLVNITPELDILPDVAHAWDVVNGGRTYVFYLRSNAKWSDGTALTASDFVYSWKRALLPRYNFLFTDLLQDIRGARAFHQGQTCNLESIGVWAVDDMTLQVELEEPNGYFLYLVPYLFPIPRHVLEACGESWAEPQNIVTNGPFRLETWHPGDSILLSRNPHYHGQFAGNVERVELCLLPSMPGQLDLYEAGSLDFFDIWTLPLEERDRARQRNVSEFISIPEVSTLFLGFNVARPPFDDVRVRRALSMATDREKLANVIMRGWVAPATGGLIPPGMSAHSPGIGLSQNIYAACQLLSEVGAPEYWKEIFSRVEALLPSGSLVPYAHSLRAQWKERLGIDVAWQILDPDPFFQQFTREPPHVYLIGWMPDCPDPGSLFPSNRIQQFTHWQNDHFDELLKRAKRTTDPDSRTRLYQEADKILMEEAVVVPLTYGRSLLLVKPWVKNISKSSLTRWLWKDVVIEPH